MYQKEDFRCVKDVLSMMVNKLKKDKENLTADELFLREMWLRADEDESGSLNEDEIYDLMVAMNINMNRSAVRKLFKEFDGDCNKTLDLEEFKLLLEKLQKRPAMEDIWVQFAAGRFNRGVFLKQPGVGKEKSTPRSPRDSKESAKESGKQGAKQSVKQSAKQSAKTSTKVSGSESTGLDAYSIKSTVSAPEYLSFWAEHQGEALTESTLLAQLQASFKGMTLSPEDLKISYSMWLQIITHSSNELFDPAKAVVHQKMTYPLTFYYIASSHNTYLEGDQLTSFSSVNRYVNDLLSGCRCVELDCWNGDNGEPIIYHGHTLTSKILFKGTFSFALSYIAISFYVIAHIKIDFCLCVDVIDAVKQNAFVASPYPVILSIENHCDTAQQGRLAEIMKSTLGELLYIPPDIEALSTPGAMFPSPEELKYKILVKGKRIEKLEYVIAQEEEDVIGPKGVKAPSFLNRVIGRTASSKKLMSGKSDDKSGLGPGNASSSGRMNSSEVLSNPSNLIDPVGPVGTVGPMKTSSLMMIMRQDSQKALDDGGEEKEKDDGEGGAVAPELSEITTLCGSKVKVFGTYEDTMAAPWGICTSYSESRVAKYFKNHVDYGHWVLYNHKHFSRIYPAGTRVDSSNYEIGEALAAGAQLIALNYQTHDTNMHFYRGKFRENGGCGYVLKPEFLISYPFKLPSPPVTLHITIISAHQLPKPRSRTKMRQIIDPFVVVQIAGVSSDVTKWHTKTINDNGFNPTYNEVSIDFYPFVSHPNSI